MKMNVVKMNMCSADDGHSKTEGHDLNCHWGYPYPLTGTKKRKTVRDAKGGALRNTIVSHRVPDMTRVKDPTESLGACIGRIDGGWDVKHANDTPGAPFLDSKVLNVDVMRTSSRAIFIDHGDGCLIVFVDMSSSRLRVTKLSQNVAKVLGNFGSMNRGDEFSFGGGGRDSWLKFRLICNGTTSKSEYKSGDGTTSGKIGSMSSIDKTGELKQRRSGECR
jgi:hypothetical protein